MCSDKISRIIGILTTYIIACYRELRDMAHHVSASVLSKTICAAIAGVMALMPISATEENDSIKITSVAPNDSLHNINDSIIIKYPYSKMIECTHIGVPFIVGGLIEMEHNKKFRELRNSFMPRFHSEVDNFTQYLPAGVMLGMKAFGVPSRSSWGEMLTADAFSAIIMAGLVNSIKYTAKLRRPDGSSNNSFPSGHTATAFMTATMLNKEYGDLSPWVGMGAYATATATGLMRMANNRHWMSDILAGAGIGIMSTEFAYWLSDIIFKRKKASSELIDHWVDFEQWNPSFLGFYANFQIPLTKYKPAYGMSFNTSTGTSAGIEGAWYWNHHLGVGGRLSVMNVHYSYNSIKEIIDTPEELNQANNGDSFEMAVFQTGIYSYIKIFRHIYFSPKALIGINRYDKTVNVFFTCPSSIGACFTTGGSIGAMVTQYFDINFFADWNALSPHNDVQNKVIQTIGLGARFSYRFKEK